MPSLRKKKPLAKPFVMTVAQVTVTLLAPGCFDTATSNPLPSTSNPPPSDFPCPSTMPASDAACPGAMDCDYGVDSCGFPQTASCIGGKWQISGQVICNPPPPDPQCPPDVPARGAACNWNWQSGFGCTYTIDIGCGMQVVSATCNSTTVTVEYTAPTCGQCATLTSESTCDTDAGCRWLTPGCDMPALPVAGCFAVDDCTGASICPTAGDTCQQVSYNPCYGKPCNACAAPVSVCLPPPAP